MSRKVWLKMNHNLNYFVVVDGPDVDEGGDEGDDGDVVDGGAVEVL